MPKRKVSSILVGVAGEYYVAAELSNLGYLASITLRNTKSIDIIATNERGSKTVNIQVKTKSPGKKKWILSEKNERIRDKNIFYVFVSLKEGKERPDYHIVPSARIATAVKKGHKEWLKKPGKQGQKHRDSNMRKWSDEKGKYLEQWELLGL
jgi:outer membrane lipoprotein-sorting protein